MACQRTPLEVWQAILRYAIAAPVFFESDPIEACGWQEFINNYREERTYWDAERHRRSLQRVCVNWNQYLKRFSHRYVQLKDVKDGHVPISAISRAIRLQINYTEVIACERIIRQAISERAEPWAEITYLLLQSEKVPGLKAIIAQSGLEWETISQLAPNLLLLYHDSLFIQEDVLLSRLTTLHLWTLNISTLPRCNFPSLKHVSISIYNQVVSNGDTLSAFLKNNGKNLLTYSDNLIGWKGVFASEICSQCPQLERIQTGLQWPPNPEFPCTLRHFQLPRDVLGFDSSRFPAEALRKAGVRTVSITTSWRYIFEVKDVFMVYVIYAIDHGLSFRDVRGITFQDMIVQMISHRKGIRPKSSDCLEA